MTQPLVAIVTPVYNGEEFLAETMDSVQAQTWPNLVHIVIDNASTDKTAEILARYANGRVPLIVHRNAQTIPARSNFEKAVQAAPRDAEYIRVLCADDLIYPESTEEMVLLAETDPAIGVIGCGHDCAGGKWNLGWPDQHSVFSGPEAIERFLEGRGMIMPVQMMFRKRVADQFQPFYSPDLPGGFDLDAMLRLLTRSKFAFVPKCLGFTRIHANSNTSLNFGPTSRTRSWTRDAQYFMRTYGPIGLGTRYETESKRFRRYYVRRILRWWMHDGKQRNLSIHFEALKQAGHPIGPFIVLDAAIDWFICRFSTRKTWDGYPGWED